MAVGLADNCDDRVANSPYLDAAEVGPCASATSRAPVGAPVDPDIDQHVAAQRRQRALDPAVLSPWPREASSGRRRGTPSRSLAGARGPVAVRHLGRERQRFLPHRRPHGRPAGADRTAPPGASVPRRRRPRGLHDVLHRDGGGGQAVPGRPAGLGGRVPGRIGPVRARRRRPRHRGTARGGRLGRRRTRRGGNDDARRHRHDGHRVAGPPAVHGHRRRGRHVRPPAAVHRDRASCPCGRPGRRRRSSEGSRVRRLAADPHEPPLSLSEDLPVST